MLSKFLSFSKDNPQKGAAPVLILVALVGVIALLAIANNAPFTNKLMSSLFPKPASNAATSLAGCWPTSGTGFAGTLAGQPNAIWCYTDYSDGPSTAVKGNNTWVDNFNHGLTLGKFDTTNYTDFPMIGSGYKSQVFRHGNHWMRDVAGSDQGGEGSNGWRFMASMMRPNMTFKAENGQLVIEGDVATRVAAYGGNLFWPEFVITTADHPGAPFKPGAPQYQSDIRFAGTYVYEAFPGSWTLGCRLQNDGGFTCALLDDGFGGDTPSRVFELSHFQCGNSESSEFHPGSIYGCDNIYGGLPTNLPAADAAYSRDCASLDPDTNCRDRWRWEITNNRLTWYANGKKYMEHTGFKPAARAAIDQLLTKPVYVYFGEFFYKLDTPARMHWDRIAINPKDANGNLLPPSTAETFCLGAPNNTCGATPAPSATIAPSPSSAPSIAPSASPTPKPSASPSPSPKPSASPTPTASVPAGGMTVTFNDKSGQNTGLNGQYPAGVIDWGSNKWYLSSPWQQFKSKSISFNGGSLKSASFNFLSPRILTNLDLYNGGSTSSTITLSCAGNANKSITVNSKQLLTAVSTGWTVPCTAVTVTSTNGWDTNFDNLIIK